MEEIILMILLKIVVRDHVDDFDDDNDGVPDVEDDDDDGDGILDREVGFSQLF